ncbi:MAG: hypothetical protein V3U87_16345 [Methylococcaceae bacterium]
MSKDHIQKYIQLFYAATGLFLSILATPTNAEDRPTILITYHYEHELLPKSKGEPLLTVFTNGKMRAVFSPTMKLAGIREAQLNAEALHELKSLILTNSSQGLSPETISEEISLYQTQQEQIKNTEKTVFAVMDSTTTIIEYQDLSKTNETTSGKPTLIKKIVQKNLSTIAKQYPGISILENTNNLKEMLQKILDISNWTSIGGN